jgi:hypothetical protein
MRDLATRKQTLDTWDIQRTAHKTASIEGETQEQTKVSCGWHALSKGYIKESFIMGLQKAFALFMRSKPTFPESIGIVSD